MLDVSRLITVGELTLDLVPEDGAWYRAAELLDVRAAEPAGADDNELPWAVGLGQIGKLRQPIRVEDDRAHRRIVGGARGRAQVVRGAPGTRPAGG